MAKALISPKMGRSWKLVNALVADFKMNSQKGPKGGLILKKVNQY